MIPSWLIHNRLFDLARSGQRITPWWGVMLVSVCIIVISQLVVFPVVIIEFAILGSNESSLLMTAAQPPLISGFWLSLSLAVMFGSLIALVWLWVRLYERRSFVTLGFEPQRALMLYGRGLLIGLASFAATVGLMALFGFIAVEDSDPTQIGLAALGGILLTLVPGWIIQGAAEEILTRGWMLPALAARYRVWIGVLVSSAFFMLMHGLNPNLSILALINLFLYGFFAALYALREGSLWGICAFHSVWNWAQGNIFGLEVSGQAVSGGMLFNLIEAGPDWFTGGAFGPEGGVVTTIVLLSGMAVIWFWPSTARQLLTTPAAAE